MKVFKFGGASVNSIERIINVSKILQFYSGQKLVVIISAMGKMTNALEKVAEAFYAENKEEALHLFNVIKQYHLDLLKNLEVENDSKAKDNLSSFFTEVEWLLHDKPLKDYAYYYDQIVCAGELLSTTIMSAYLNKSGVLNEWIDVRDVLRTDDNFRDATIDMSFTQNKINEKILPLFSNTNIVLTQGFIGSTDENESTTLGREGSDYTAAIFANMLSAEDLTIWKDVEGVMNADPKDFPDAKFMPELSFSEVIEMAYFGAQVIHPKTIKPLQNKKISLHVRCFIHPELPGSVISEKQMYNHVPIIILKQNQLLMKLSSKDFSFVGEKPVSRLYEIFEEIKIRPNLTQNGAISMLCCLDDITDKTERLALTASEIFEVQVEKDLTLLTIRHYTPEIISDLTENKKIILEQKTNDTIQVLMRSGS